MSSPENFRDKVLGAWSSHHHWTRRRQRLFALAVFLPLAVALVAALIAAADIEHWASMLRQRAAWLTVLGAAFTFALAALMSLSLCGRIAAWQSTHGGPRFGDAVTHSVDPWVLGAAIVLGAAGPFFLSRLTFVPASIRFLLLCFAVFPLAGLLLALRVLARHDPPDEAAQRARRRPIWLLLLLMVLALWAVTVVHDLGVIYERTAWRAWAAQWIPWYASLDQPLLGMAALLPVAFVVFVLWELWPAAAPLSSGGGAKPASAGAARKRSSWGRRIVGFFRWLFGLPEPAAPPPEPAPPAWLNDLFEDLGQSGPAELVTLPPEETSPPSGRDDLKFLFGGHVPTADQLEVYERFHSYHRRLIESGDGADGAEFGADLVVLGNPGSGKTTALTACAVYAALVRGQRVLFLVPTLLRQEAILERIEAFLRQLSLHYYVKAAVATDEAVARWLHGGEPAPHILISTPPAAERHLYAFRGLRGQLPALRRLLRLCEVVIVDDFLDLEDAPRSHLAFLLDKQRLLLAAEGLPLQVLLSCGRLTSLGEEILGKRLFTIREFDPARNAMAIKPPSGARAWRVRLETADVPGTVEAMVEWCLEHGLDVVLYRRGIDEDERRRQEAAFAVKGRGRIAVLSDLDRPLAAISPLEVDAVFYQEAAHEDLCLALRRHAGHDETVIFSIAPHGAEKEPQPAVVPVVADRTTAPLQADHLRGLARLLRPWTPIPSRLWGRLGLEPSGLPIWPPEVRRASPWFDMDAWNEREYQRELWAYICLGEEWDRPHAVRATELAESCWGVYASPNRSRLGAGRAAEPDRATARFDRRRARRAAWFDGDVQLVEAGSTDLAHQHQLRILWGRRSIVLQAIQQAPDGSIRLFGDVWHGNGVDRYLPVFDLRWSVPEGCRAANLWGGPDDGLQWFELHGDDAEISVTARIVGQMSDYGQVTAISPVEFQYDARLAGLVVGPGAIDDPGRAIAAAAAGDWATNQDHGRFSPALTGALNFALRRKAPGLPYFARVAAFQLAGDSADVGRAVVWMLEPTSGGRTASSLIAAMLRHREELAALLESAQWFLAQLGKDELPPAQVLRRLSACGFRGDEGPEPLHDAARLIEDASDKLKRVPLSVQAR
jgi:hypothetical protein